MERRQKVHDTIIANELGCRRPRASLGASL